jgi:hypothetical protein
MIFSISTFTSVPVCRPVQYLLLPTAAAATTKYY